MTQEFASAPSGRKLWIGGGVAVLVAAALLVFVVLPAETGWDPLGTGKASGLNDLSKAGEMTELERGALRTGVFHPSDKPIVSDVWTRELAPFESIEFKYTISEGQPMIFKWEATGPVKYVMHGHPFEGGTELTESYGIDTAESVEGGYIAPFTGIHGWFWQNTSMDNVTLTLTATGMMESSTVFDGPAEIEREIPVEEAGEGA